MEANYVQRIRLVFSKTANTRFIGHLDMVRTLERAINRAQIPVAYTQGFNKRLRMQLADPLPLGFSSECEMADIWLAEMVDPSAAMAQLEPVLPNGVVLHGATQVPISEPALQTQTIEAVYLVRPFLNIEDGELQSRLDGLLNSSSIPMERNGKEYDLRPRIVSIDLSEEQPQGTSMAMRLSLSQGLNGRPDEVLRALGLDPLAARIHRQKIILAN
jgi:radical SAM-linked protein